MATLLLSTEWGRKNFAISMPLGFFLDLIIVLMIKDFIIK